ncbi:hypothetical protein [Seonamhaeicola marinus]|uniref:Uncharacterized protein n=1 Tax=Seonamhaeicola marinus TaxID=1912246 RepID=A0A5D0HUD9_9FLAO|nr:hypothetical protein [Seonamhaeicola marinus]TYA74938.1 hypothetical protein FUA24_16700 [Seonamhaeicola marinus]
MSNYKKFLEAFSSWLDSGSMIRFFLSNSKKSGKINRKSIAYLSAYDCREKTVIDDEHIHYYITYDDDKDDIAVEFHVYLGFDGNVVITGSYENKVKKADRFTFQLIVRTMDFGMICGRAEVKGRSVLCHMSLD